MKNALNTTLFAFIISVLAGCSSNLATGKPPSYAAKDGSLQYELGIGDTIDIRVWKNAELSVVVSVRPDGMVSMPLVGELVALGKSPGTLKQEISEKLGDFVKNPIVTVIVSNPQSVEYQQRVRVTGAVSVPTSLAWKNGMTVLDLVIICGK